MATNEGKCPICNNQDTEKVKNFDDYRNLDHAFKKALTGIERYKWGFCP